MQNQPRGEIAGVQWMRALAAMFVVYYHTGVYNEQFRWLSFVPREFGASGVDAFFVISGFIMMLVTARSNVLPREFLTRRVIRIVPLYWGVSLAIAAVGLIYPAAMLANEVSLSHLLLSLAFLPHDNPVTGAITPFFKLGWTLNYEMYFYALFALLLLVPDLKRRTTILVVYGLSVSLIFAIFNPQLAVIRVYTNPIINEFVMGAVIGYFFVTGGFAQFPASKSLALIAIGLMILVFAPWQDDFRAAILGVGGAALLCGMLGLESTGKLPRAQWAVTLGDASYSIYLMHPIVETLFRLTARFLHLPVENVWIGAPCIVLATIGSALFGVWVHRHIEKPLLKQLTGLRARVAERKIEYRLSAS